MKYFLILLFGSLSFFASAQVSISPEVARYFLERDDLASVLIKKDSLSIEIILNLNQQLTIQNSIIDTYKADSVTFTDKLSVKDEEIDLLNKEAKILKKQIRKERFLKVVGFVGLGVVIIISFL